MAITNRPWTVTPHGPLLQIDDNLWRVSSPVPGLPGAMRSMHVIKLSTGQLAFHNAVPVDEPTLEKVRALGAPKILIIPHRAHNIDGPAFAEKFQLQVWCPEVERVAIDQRMPVKGSLDQWKADKALDVELLKGFKNHEPVLFVHTEDGQRTHLLFTDAVMNNPHGKGVSGLITRLTGFTGKVTVGPVLKLFYARDKQALREQFLKLAKTPKLSFLVPSHGDIVREGAAAHLERLAQTF